MNFNPIVYYMPWLPSFTEILGSLATEMDELCKEQDEAKAVIKKQWAEYQIKEELSDYFKLL